MPNDSKRNNREIEEKREKLWDALNAGSGGAYQLDVHALLKEEPLLKPIEARMKTLADAGMTNGRIMEKLGIGEQTFYNHTSRMRKIAGAEERADIRSLFVKPKPNDKNIPPDSKENL